MDSHTVKEVLAGSPDATTRSKIAPVCHAVVQIVVTMWLLLVVAQKIVLEGKVTPGLPTHALRGKRPLQ